MENLKIIIMLPLLILGFLLLGAIDLVLRVKGKPSLMEEWDNIYIDDIVNYEQGEMREMKKTIIKNGDDANE